MLSREATNTNFIVFGLTRPGLESTIYSTRGEHAHNYTTNAILQIWILTGLIQEYNIFYLLLLQILSTQSVYAKILNYEHLDLPVLYLQIQRYFPPGILADRVHNNCQIKIGKWILYMLSHSLLLQYWLLGDLAILGPIKQRKKHLKNTLIIYIRSCNEQNCLNNLVILFLF